MTREVLSHFLFFSERLLGPLKVVFAHPSYPADRSLCETHLLARLETPQQQAVSILASVGGAQPDCQQVTIKGSTKSRRVAEFSLDMESSGGPFVPLEEAPADRRAVALKAQLDELGYARRQTASSGDTGRGSKRTDLGREDAGVLAGRDRA